MPTRSIKPRHAFWLSVGLLVLGWLAALVFIVLNMRAEALDGARSALRTHARNFEEHLTQIIEFTELMAKNMEPVPDALAEGRRLDAMLKPTPFIRSLSLIDERGRIVASSNADNVGVTVPLSAFYPAGAPAADDVVRIGRSWVGRDWASARELRLPLTGVAPSLGFIPVLQRVPTRPSTWLLATLNPDFLANHWIQLLEEDGGGGIVQLLRYDDLLLAATSEQAALGATGQAGAIAQRIAARDHDVFDQTLPDGPRVLTAYRVSKRYPIFVTVHFERDHVLAVWAERVGWLVAITAPIALALGLAGALLLRRRRRMLTQARELEAQRRLAESVFNSSTVPMLLTSADGAIIAINPAFTEVTGYTSGDVIGKNPRLLRSAANPAEVYQGMWSTIAKGKPWRGELLNLKKNGDAFWVALTISPVLDAAGRTDHFIGSMEDISERRQQMSELAQAKQAAEAASVAKSQFLASMSHELRTPLNAIYGYAQLFEMDPDLPPEKLEFAREILHAANHLIALINDLLDMSRIELGKLEFNPIPVQPRTVEQESLRLVAARADEAGLSLSCDPGDGQDVWINVDPLRLRQVIVNLLSNAIKYNRPHGRVCLTSRRRGHVVRMSVDDTGLGIAPDKQSRIFTAFDRLGVETGAIEGTGIGLLITKRITESMGGQIGFESVQGQGSTFWIEFPLCDPPAG